MTHSFDFSNTWFESARPVWDQLLPQLAPSKILEIGSFEGASACYLIQKLGTTRPIELHCIDTWEGGAEHRRGGAHQSDMSAVERRFRENTAKAVQACGGHVSLVIHKGPSDLELSKLLASPETGRFDFIYVDGSHQAPDVLCDALLSFRLLRVGGVMAFDDYLWRDRSAGGNDLLRSPKPAIDAFTNIYFHKLKIVSAPLQQLYICKTSD